MKIKFYISSNSITDKQHRTDSSFRKLNLLEIINHSNVTVSAIFNDKRTASTPIFKFNNQFTSSKVKYLN